MTASLGVTLAARNHRTRSIVSVAGHSHISAFYEADDLLLPSIVELLRAAT